MAIFHLHAQIIKRSSGRSSVAAAAYRAGEKIRNDYDGITHDYTRKSGVVHSEIMLPENAPKEYTDRAVLWNAVEKAEKRKDSQTAREIDIALPFELNRKEQIELVREYVKENFVSVGMCTDFAVHDKNDGNPHAHIMLTTREVSKNGFGVKRRDWNDKTYLETWREHWADICNEKLRGKGIDEKIDHRTLKEQDIEREPTIHIGATAKSMEKTGRNSDRIKINEEITAQNKSGSIEITAGYIHELKQAHSILNKEITSIKQKITNAQQESQSLKFKTERIAEHAENIQVMGNQFESLKTKRQATGLFENKKDIDKSIESLERSLEQAKTAFKKEYFVYPKEAQAKIKRLEFKMKDFEQIKERLQDGLVFITAERDVFVFEYQLQKQILEISPNGQSIQKDLEILYKQELENLSVQEKLDYSRSQHTLEIVTEKSFQRILDEVSPEQARKLIKYRERERARDYMNIRHR